MYDTSKHGSWPETDLELMALHLAARFVTNTRGRLLAARDSLEPPPLFSFIRTAHGNLWRFRSRLSRRTVQTLARYAGKELVLSPERSGPERLHAFVRALAVAERTPLEGAADEEACVPHWTTVHLLDERGLTPDRVRSLSLREALDPEVVIRECGLCDTERRSLGEESDFFYVLESPGRGIPSPELAGHSATRFLAEVIDFY
jgi:hypothetical protein